jgi:hypothetical protein
LNYVQGMDEEQLREKLAALAHQRWTEWMEWVFEVGVHTKDGDVLIPSWAVKRWKRQMKTQYNLLSFEEQQSDRAEADQILQVLNGRSDS